jgi:hypothetical protein
VVSTALTEGVDGAGAFAGGRLAEGLRATMRHGRGAERAVRSVAALFAGASIAIVLVGCGPQRRNDLVACRTAVGANASTQSVEGGVGDCMKAKGYRLDTYSNGCGAGAAPQTGASRRADCWLAPGQAPSNYPFPHNGS